MNHYLIVCRSVTQAQRVSRLLTMADIFNQVFRSPIGTTERGCSYSVRVRADHLNRAMAILQEHHIDPMKVVVE